MMPVMEERPGVSSRLITSRGWVTIPALRALTVGADGAVTLHLRGGECLSATLTLSEALDQLRAYYNDLAFAGWVQVCAGAWLNLMGGGITALAVRLSSGHLSVLYDRYEWVELPVGPDQRDAVTACMDEWFKQKYPQVIPTESLE